MICGGKHSIKAQTIDHHTSSGGVAQIHERHKRTIFSMKKYSLFKKVLAPLIAITVLVATLSFFYVFNQNLNRVVQKAQEEAFNLSNLLLTSKSLVAEHVFSNMVLLKQKSYAQGSPNIRGTVLLQGQVIPNLFFGNTQQTANTNIVDFVSNIGNGSATVFVKQDSQFIRIATNVQKADGSNAFGTQLDPNGEVASQLLQNKPYAGVVDILGESYLSVYEPMFDTEHHLIGAWYVGRKLDFKALTQSIQAWSFMEHGFVAVTDSKQRIRFLTKSVEVDTAEKALKNANGSWKIITREVPEWHFNIHILYPAAEAYLASLQTLVPWLVTFIFMSLLAFIMIKVGLNRFVLGPLGAEPETARQLLMRIEKGDFSEDETQAPANTLIANIVIMRRRLREILNAMQQNANHLKVSSSVFEHAHDAIFITDTKGLIVQSNPSFTLLTGYIPSDCIGKQPESLGLACHEPDFFKHFYHTAKKHDWIGEMWNRRRDGNEYLVEMELLPVTDESGTLQHYVGLFSDITHAKAQRNILEHMAYHDALTQLPNRVLFSQRLHEAVIAAQHQESSLAICYFDLDDFKIVNDQHGHDYGDKLLQLLSARILGALNPQDTLARLGGDEFAILICGEQSLRDYKRTLGKLLSLIEKPFIIEHLKFSISASIGYTIYPSDPNPPDTLLRHADHAMYYAKTHGGHQCQLFDLASAHQSQHEQSMFKDILSAIQHNEIKLVYQPQIDLQTGEVVSFEALLRWQHPTRGLLKPKDFLHMIENTSLISDIGSWVLDETVRQLAIWNMQGLQTRTAVNIAAYHLTQKKFAFHLSKLFKKYPTVLPSQLHLEITESAAISDFNKVNKVIHQCHAIGVTFSIDDFGAGYSSLIYLRRLPVDIIKIDQSFIYNMLNNEEDMAVIRGVINMCREFNRKVVAEGVELAEQAWALQAMGCDYAQGYGISKGLSGHKIPEWMQKNHFFKFDA